MMPGHSKKISFPGSAGAALAARLDYPQGKPHALALFAHCFTCSKDLFAASRIANELCKRGFAVFRFDFTGLGMSEGEFANTNFSSNIQDLRAAAAFLRETVMPVDILIGHSLGGAAVLAAAGNLPEVKAVATIGAPADAAHVARNFAAHIDEIRKKGEATVTLAGRTFTIKQQFLEDLEATHLAERISALRKALLIFHAPTDAVVGLENASMIFGAAKHPKSFIALQGADHLLSKREDAVYVAGILSAWASRYIMGSVEAEDTTSVDPGTVVVTETRDGKFQQEVRIGRHRLLADEPHAQGGNDTGPGPYDYLAIALGACTSMTVRLYADLKQLPLEKVQVRVRHDKRYLEDCKSCAEEKPREKPVKIDHFERIIRFEGNLDEPTRQKLLVIANKCPVHNTLESGAKILTSEDRNEMGAPAHKP